jgi:hypothetical protein
VVGSANRWGGFLQATGNPNAGAVVYPTI